MAITLNGTTGITTPDIDVTAQSTDIVTTGDVSAVDGTFSGGVYLGGTGAANYMDDYEEGTFTPTFTNVSIGNGEVYGTYVKVGNVVNCFFGFKVESTTSVSGLITSVNGLPFTSKDRGSRNAYTTASGTAWDAGTGWAGVYASMNDNTTGVSYVLTYNNDAGINTTTPFTWATGDTLNLNITYEVN